MVWVYSRMGIGVQWSTRLNRINGGMDYGGFTKTRMDETIASRHAHNDKIRSENIQCFHSAGTGELDDSNKDPKFVLFTAFQS